MSLEYAIAELGEKLDKLGTKVESLAVLMEAKNVSVVTQQKTITSAVKDVSDVESDSKPFERKSYGWDHTANVGTVYEKGDFPLEGYDGLKKNEFIALCNKHSCDIASGLPLASRQEAEEEGEDDVDLDADMVEPEESVDDSDSMDDLDADLGMDDFDVEPEVEVTEDDVKAHVAKLKKSHPDTWKKIVGQAFKSLGANNFSQIKNYPACLKAIKNVEKNPDFN